MKGEEVRDTGRFWHYVRSCKTSKEFERGKNKQEVNLLVYKQNDRQFDSD